MVMLAEVAVEEDIVPPVSRQGIVDEYAAAFAVLKSQAVPIDLIQECVARFAGVSRKQLLGQRRTKDVAEPRQIAMYLAYELTDSSLPHIAREFHKKDHTTVMWARDRVRERVRNEPLFAARVEALRDAVFAAHQRVRAEGWPQQDGGFFEVLRDRAVAQSVRKPWTPPAA